MRLRGTSQHLHACTAMFKPAVQSTPALLQAYSATPAHACHMVQSFMQYPFSHDTKQPAPPACPASTLLLPKKAHVHRQATLGLLKPTDNTTNLGSTCPGKPTMAHFLKLTSTHAPDFSRIGPDQVTPRCMTSAARQAVPCVYYHKGNPTDSKAAVEHAGVAAANPKLLTWL